MARVGIVDAFITVFSVSVGMPIGLYGQLPFPKVITDF